MDYDVDVVDYAAPVYSAPVYDAPLVDPLVDYTAPVYDTPLFDPLVDYTPVYTAPVYTAPVVAPVVDYAPLYAADNWVGDDWVVPVCTECREEVAETCTEIHGAEEEKKSAAKANAAAK